MIILNCGTLKETNNPRMKFLSHMNVDSSRGTQRLENENLNSTSNTKVANDIKRTKFHAHGCESKRAFQTARMTNTVGPSGRWSNDGGMVVMQCCECQWATSNEFSLKSWNWKSHIQARVVGRGFKRERVMQWRSEHSIGSTLKSQKKMNSTPD